jgi:hypothetical protein
MSTIIPDPDRRRRAREPVRSSTLHQHGQSQADEINQGRFAARGKPVVIGTMPSPASAYPAASAAHQTELPPEEPLGYDEMPLENPAGVFPASAPADTGGAPSQPQDVEAPPPSSNKGSE